MVLSGCVGIKNRHIPKPSFQHNALLPDLDHSLNLAFMMTVIDQIPSIVAAIPSVVRGNLRESILVARLGLPRPFLGASHVSIHQLTTALPRHTQEGTRLESRPTRRYPLRAKYPLCRLRAQPSLSTLEFLRILSRQPSLSAERLAVHRNLI